MTRPDSDGAAACEAGAVEADGERVVFPRAEGRDAKTGGWTIQPAYLAAVQVSAAEGPTGEDAPQHWEAVELVLLAVEPLVLLQQAALRADLDAARAEVHATRAQVADAAGLPHPASMGDYLDMLAAIRETSVGQSLAEAKLEAVNGALDAAGERVAEVHARNERQAALIRQLSGDGLPLDMLAAATEWAAADRAARENPGVPLAFERLKRAEDGLRVACAGVAGPPTRERCTACHREMPAPGETRKGKLRVGTVRVDEAGRRIHVTRGGFDCGFVAPEGEAAP